MKISTNNEYGNLKSIIVGSVENMSWPSDDKEFNAGIDRSTYPGTLTRGALPKEVINEATGDLDRLVQILENRDIEVHRPLTSQPHWAYSARDILLTVGEKLIQCPTPFESRANEIELYPFLKDCEVVMAPRPKSNEDPCFDAANVLKIDDKLLYSLSHSANEAGAEWLQQQVGTEFEVVKWQVVEHSITHIDSTLLTLNQNTVIVNASRIKEKDLPKFMNDYNKIWVDDVEARRFHQFPYASKWIGMNVLSLDPETVMVDEIQKNLITKIEDNGFKVISTPMRQSRTLGGGFHCVTNDLERE
jgi:scyllo-inosamine-4-phosphate amidinotransferase 1